MAGSTIALNRRARHDFEVLARYEAGIVLTGSEIKSIRQHKVQLQGSYARLKEGELWLEDCHIAPYSNAGYTPHDPRRPRKLLLRRKELRKLEEAVGEQGLTLIPLAMYLKRGMAKVEVGVCRGLKRYDKRQKIAERDTRRDVERALRR
ncbi:MAG: SsrA-binding protein SmpB [Dehalococcoidia bacterium]